MITRLIAAALVLSWPASVGAQDALLADHCRTDGDEALIFLNELVPAAPDAPSVIPTATLSTDAAAAIAARIRRLGVHHRGQCSTLLALR